RLGYSPERINPGDRTHRIDKITKVIAGEDEEVVEQLATIYGAITEGGVFRAASIKAAEGAKAIENAQRDINIAFMNEVAQIFSRIGVSVWDVLAAARTKWNFLPFEPGLVGGHCIGVDPYYLSYLAERLGHHPQVILAGRETNDGMGAWIADALHDRRRKAGSALVLGLTFKEDVPDLRNSRSFEGHVARAQSRPGDRQVDAVKHDHLRPAAPRVSLLTRKRFQFAGAVVFAALLPWWVRGPLLPGELFEPASVNTLIGNFIAI